MELEEFNSTALREDYPEAIEYDLRPFGPQQAEAVDFYLQLALKQGDPFGKKVLVRTDATVVLSAKARESLAQLQARGVCVGVVGVR